jgi:hypothetical protein
MTTSADALALLDDIDAAYLELDRLIRACLTSPIQSGFQIEPWNLDYQQWRGFRDGPLSSSRRRQLDPQGVVDDVAPFARALLIQRQSLDRFCPHVTPVEPSTPDYLLLADNYVPPAPRPAPVRVPTRTQTRPSPAPTSPAPSAPVVLVVPASPPSGSGIGPFIVGGLFAGLGALVWKGMRRGTSR